MNGKMKQHDERITCTDPELGDLFISYLSGRVSADERRRIESHLPQCEECREELRFFEVLKKLQKEKSLMHLLQE